ncbi:MAG TPA: DUF222 domain-containing protein [Mycobacterium sp.]|nr:DUF222 domain-containing protein [Mycobacterium sp.]
MFDQSLLGPDSLFDPADADVVAAIAGWARVEAAAAARRLAAAAELVGRRCEPESGAASEHWACDDWDAAAAEVAAAQNIGHRAASSQMHQANALRHRFPRVLELFLAGEIGLREC